MDRPKDDSLTQTEQATNKANEDSSAKQILKNRNLLACILKAVVPEYKDIPELEIASRCIEPESIKVHEIPVSKNLTNIQGLSEEDVTINEGTIKYDVIFMTHIPIKDIRLKYERDFKESIVINLEIDLEAQNNYNPGYPIEKRAMFYAARMLSAEFDGVAEIIDYNKLYKVYSIWICFDVPKYLENTITRFKIEKEDILGKVELKERNYNLMESVIIRLSKDDNLIGNHLIDTLQTIFGHANESKLKRLEDLGYKGTSLEREVVNMMSFADRTEKYAIKKGLKKGREEGREEGRKEGRKEGRIEGQKELLLKISKGKTTKELAKMLGLDEKEIEEILSA